jgi:hypothetical protein
VRRFPYLFRATTLAYARASERMLSESGRGSPTPLQQCCRVAGLLRRTPDIRFCFYCRLQQLENRLKFRRGRARSLVFGKASHARFSTNPTRRGQESATAARPHESQRAGHQGCKSADRLNPFSILTLPQEGTESRLRGYSTAERQTEPGWPFVCFPAYRQSRMIIISTTGGTKSANSYIR